MISGRVDVFVSYRHHASSTPWVREVLVPALELAGFSVVIDVRDFPAGAVVMSEMEVASTHARVTVAVIDETYADGGFVEAERHLATRLIAVRRADVGDHVAVEAALTVDATATDDPASVVDAVRQLIRRVFVLEAPDDTEWVNGVLLPTLDRTDASAESCGGLVAGEQWTDAVLERLVRADRVVIVLSRAYLREVHPRAGTLVAHVEAEEHRAMALPLRREADVEVPALLRTREIIDASRDELWDAALERLCAAVGVPLPPTEGPPPCPYPGMRPFGEGEHDHFFGRDREIEEVLGALRRRRFVAIIGPSASGKSSLARAGVAPALVARGSRDGESWMVQVVRPGARPLETLGAVAKAWREARRDPTGGSRRLLLIIDQLEELYAPDVEGREELEREVAHLVSDEGDLYVVVTVRADFYPQVMSGALWPLVSANRVEVVPLRGAGLRAAIREPARGRGVVVAEALVERLAGETEGQPGLLPFLQETLVTLWGSLRHRLLTVEAYERLGDDSGSGVLQAIRREATAAVGEICARYPDGEQVVRGIMLRLVQFGEGRPHTRRRLPIDALRGAASDDAAFTAVFDTLVAHRLITVEGEPQSPQYADLSHEAIIRGWPDLARWIEERQATEAARRRLLEDTRSWEERTEQGHPELGLLESLDLADAERWRQSADAKDLGIDPAINRFIDASAARAASRRRRRRLSIVAVIAALSLVALVLAFATVQARRAQHEAERASRQRLALQLRSASGDQGLSLRALLVRAADRLEPDQLSLVEMLTTAESERFIATRIDSPGTKVGLDAMWIDDQVAIAGAGDGTVYVWPMTPDGPDLLSRRTFEVGRTPLAMAREPGTDLLAIGAGNGSPEAGSFPGSRGGVELVDLGQAELKPRSLGLSGDSPASRARLRRHHPGRRPLGRHRDACRRGEPADVAADPAHPGRAAGRCPDLCAAGRDPRPEGARRGCRQLGTVAGRWREQLRDRHLGSPRHHLDPAGARGPHRQGPHTRVPARRRRPGYLADLERR